MEKLQTIQFFLEIFLHFLVKATVIKILLEVRWQKLLLNIQLLFDLSCYFFFITQTKY